MAAMNEIEQADRFETLALIKPLAEDILLTPGRIVDASALIKGLPDDEWQTACLRDVRVQFEEAYFCFGKQKSLIIDPVEGLYFEGAYVKKTNRYGKWTYDIILVANDPGFDNADERPLGETLRGLTRHFHLLIPGDRPLISAVLGMSQSCDGSILGDRSAAIAGVTMAAKIVMYLGGPSVDAEMGYATGAPKGMIEKARFDPWVQQDLNWKGYPRMVFLGRNTNRVQAPNPRPQNEQTQEFRFVRGF